MKRFIILLVLSTVLSVGCTRYEHEFLSNCDKVNDQTIKCYVCDSEFLADFPIVEDHTQIKTRIVFADGQNCGNLLFYYGGQWDKIRLSYDDAKYLYTCVKDYNNDDYDYGDTTDDTTTVPAARSTRDIIDDLNAIRKSSPSKTTTIKPYDWRDTL